jgi:Spy/CpxP family protein refolding chaperone
MMNYSRSRTFLPAFLVAAATLLIAGSTSAWPGRPAGPGGPGGPDCHGPGGSDGFEPAGHFGRALDRLGIEGERRERIEALLESSRGPRDALRERLETAHGRMRALLEAEPVDEAAVMAQADATGLAATDLRKQDLASMIAVARELTPGERARLRSWREERRDSCERDRRQGRGREGAPPRPRS